MRKAVWLLLPFSAAVFLWHYLLPDGAVPFVLLLFVAGVLFASLAKGTLRLRVLFVSVGILAGSLCCWCQDRFVIDPAESHVGEIRTVTARVTDAPDVYDGSEYVTVLLTEPGLPRVKCRLVSYVEGELAPLVPGDIITGEMRFVSASVRSGQEIDNYTSQGIFLRAVCTDEPEITGAWRLARLYAPKRAAAAVGRLCARLFPGDTAPFMTALLTGEKGPLYQDGDAYYRLSSAGLSHVVAVSGMHISFLMGFLFLLLGRKRSALIVCLPALLFFAAMAGFTPSVVRAALMQAALLIAPVFGREEDAPTALAVILAALLLCNPSAAGSVSLQLSFASVAGIRLFSERLFERWRAAVEDGPLGRRAPLRGLLLGAAGSVSTSLGALAFTMPLTAAHFGYISVGSPVSNVLCLWVISLLYVGGYVTVLLGVLFPPAGAAAGAVLAWGVRYVFFIAGLTERIPCGTVYMSHPVFVLWLCFAYAAFLLAWLLGRKTERGVRLIAPACLTLILLYVFSFAVRLGWKDELRLTALDVGQGESVLLTYGPRAVMVDCGGSYVRDDPGNTAVRYLGGQQRRSLDALILTHLHSDHVNGVPALLSQIRVDTLYMPREEDEDGYLPSILAAAAAAGTRVEYVTENLRLTVGEMELTLFAPLLPEITDENENGLVVLAARDGFEALITGDAPAAAEYVLTSRYELPDIEVLVAGHHGSRTSTGAKLLETVKPDIAVISVGYNLYGHPHWEVLQRLQSYGIEVLRTDELGNVTVTDGRRMP